MFPTHRLLLHDVIDVHLIIDWFQFLFFVNFVSLFEIFASLFRGGQTNLSLESHSKPRTIFPILIFPPKKVPRGPQVGHACSKQVIKSHDMRELLNSYELPTYNLFITLPFHVLLLCNVIIIRTITSFPDQSFWSQIQGLQRANNQIQGLQQANTQIWGLFRSTLLGPLQYLIVVVIEMFLDQSSWSFIQGLSEKANLLIKFLERVPS